MQFLFWILDVRIDEEGVRFAVDVLDCDLEAIEAPGFRGRDFGGEVATLVLVDDPIKGSNECEDMGDEVTFGVGQSDPESVKLLLRFSLMIPLEAAKNARTWEMK